MAKQIVQLGRRGLNANANKVSSSLNFFVSPCNSSHNRFQYSYISRLVKPNGKCAFDEDALAPEEHPKMKREKLHCELRDIINELRNNLYQEEHVLERESMKLNNDLEEVRREIRDILNQGIAHGDPLYSDMCMRLLSVRNRDDLANKNAETTNLNNKLDQEEQQTTDNAFDNAVKKLRSNIRDMFTEFLNPNNNVDQVSSIFFLG